MASDNFPGPFPATLTQPDREFILLTHHVRNSKAKSCVHCQASILNTFYDFSLHHNTGLQLSPAQLVKVHLYSPPDAAQRVQVARDEMLAWAVDNPADFEVLLHEKWLALFESAAATDPNNTTNTRNNQNNQNNTVKKRNPAEEWLTKLWLACAGEYTVPDLARGRPFAGMRARYVFEGMHLRRLVAAQRPFHAGGRVRCVCPDRRSQYAYSYIRGGGKGGKPKGKEKEKGGFVFQPWVGSAVAEGLQHAVVMRHTDKGIMDVYEWFCEELVARGE